MAKKNWIQAMHMKKGALRETLHAKSGKPLTATQLSKAIKMGGKTAKRANLAKTLKKFKK